MATVTAPADDQSGTQGNTEPSATPPVGAASAEGAPAAAAEDVPESGGASLAAVPSSPQTLAVDVPPGADHPGQIILVNGPSGQFQAEVPAGVSAGQQFSVQVPTLVEPELVIRRVDGRQDYILPKQTSRTYNYPDDVYPNEYSQTCAAWMLVFVGIPLATVIIMFLLHDGYRVASSCTDPGFKKCTNEGLVISCEAPPPGGYSGNNSAACVGPDGDDWTENGYCDVHTGDCALGTDCADCPHDSVCATATFVIVDETPCCLTPGLKRASDDDYYIDGCNSYHSWLTSHVPGVVWAFGMGLSTLFFHYWWKRLTQEPEEEANACETVLELKEECASCGTVFCVSFLCMTMAGMGFLVHVSSGMLAVMYIFLILGVYTRMEIKWIKAQEESNYCAMIHELEPKLPLEFHVCAKAVVREGISVHSIPTSELQADDVVVVHSVSWDHGHFRGQIGANCWVSIRTKKKDILMQPLVVSSAVSNNKEAGTRVESEAEFDGTTTSFGNPIFENDNTRAEPELEAEQPP